MSLLLCLDFMSNALCSISLSIGDIIYNIRTVSSYSVSHSNDDDDMMMLIFKVGCRVRVAYFKQ